LKNYFDLPFIVNFYGYDVLRLPREFGWKWRYKKLAREGDLYFVGSADMKEKVIGLGFPAEKIKVLKLGMNMDQIEFQHREKAGRRLMMVGRMVEKKGFEYAIRAVKHLKDQNEEVTLDLYGDGELSSDLQELTSQKGVEDQVTFHGQVNNEKVFKELYNHDILLVPSVQAEDGDREGIPQTTVEGMATGIPVITSDHSGLPELIKDHESGLQVPQRDSEALCNAIQTYLDNPSLVAEVSIGGGERVEQEHDINKQVRKAEKWYQQLL
jgi:glycosyltransferase involved in cell wall biosynthesis